jgi:hypothetical protein
MPQNPNDIPSNHSPEDLAIWLFGACCEDLTDFEVLRKITRKAAINAGEMYGDADTDDFGVIETLGRFAAKLDQLYQQEKEDV